MIKYRIGTEYLDQFDKDSSFAISKAVSKVGEINLRHGDRSTGFKVPLTDKNTKLLNYVTILNSSTTNDSFKKVIGQLVEEETVISDGYFQVTKYNPYKKEVDIRFYGGNTDWFSELKDLKINEIAPIESNSNYDVRDLLNIIVSPTTIKNSFNTDLDDNNPYKFFLIDNNRDTTRNTSNDVILPTTIRDYQLGVSQGVIFDRVFQGLGITLKGNMFDDPKYYNTLITASKDMQIVADKVDFLDSTEMSKTPQYLQSNTYSTLSFTENAYSIPEWDGRVITLQGDCLNISISFYVYFNGTDAHSTDRTLTYKVTKNKGLSGEVVLINDTDRTMYEDVIEPSYSGFVGRSVFSAFDNVSLLGAFVLGDTITVEYKTDIQDNIPSRPYYAANLEDYVNFIPSFSFELHEYIRPATGNDVLPDFSQANFVKDVLTQFGAITQYDVKTKTLTCNKFSIIDNNRIFAPDWSKKIDLSTPPKVDFTKVVSKYGKRSFFKYEENDEGDILSTLYNKITNYGLGEGALFISNDFLTDDKDFYKSLYSPTVMTGTFPFDNDDESLRANFFLPFVPLYTKTGVDEWDENDLKPRKFLYLGYGNIDTFYRGNCTSLTIDGIHDSTSMPLVYFDKNNYPYGFSSPINDYKESLSFGNLNDLTKSVNSGSLLKQTNTSLGNNNNNILDENYAFQKKILNKPIFLEINLMLTPIDVQTVDFFTPIWLDFGLDSGYYYIDEISQYKGQDKSTRVNLVKI